MNSINRLLHAAGTIIVLALVVSFITSGGLDSGNAGNEGVRPSSNAENRKPVTLSSGEQLTPLSSRHVDSLLKTMSQEKPVFIMVYASWCPHCKRMLPLLNDIQQQRGDAIHIAIISIDNRPELARKVADTLTPLALDAYIIRDGDAYHYLGEMMREDGLSFKGGLGSGVGVPYNTVYVRGKPVAELNGAIDEARMQRMIDEIITNSKAG